MTETDNPDVKKHIEPIPENTDEFLARLSNLTMNDRDIRKYFASREIKPTLVIAHYNSYTKKFEFTYGEPVFQTNTTSADTHTFTVPAGESWKVIFVSYVDNTTNYNASLVITDADGNAMLFTATGVVAAATTSTWTMPAPITIREGGVVETTNAAFVALDDVLTIVYVEVIK